MERINHVDVYLDKNTRESVNLGELAAYLETKPENLWRKNYYLFRKIIEDENWGIHVLSSLKMPDFFWMDRDGNEISGTDDGEEKKTGFRVNGTDGKNLGSWEDIFIPIQFAKELDEEVIFLVSCE